ncbi:hypothetical protein AOQ84DRAFT_93109 [Glonium stellatum]|uniref:Uncharacterized protein n=1 Tax=Glonium stellatum TaxID=574774 RepID=A0A8E2EWN2_9PEZI|nr:hypothetical protein AOQ84DRAFT_93109 [Glonium stellatum]
MGDCSLSSIIFPPILFSITLGYAGLWRYNPVTKRLKRATGRFAFSSLLICFVSFLVSFFALRFKFPTARLTSALYGISWLNGVTLGAIQLWILVRSGQNGYDELVPLPYFAFFLVVIHAVGISLQLFTSKIEEGLQLATLGSFGLHFTWAVIITCALTPICCRKPRAFAREIIAVLALVANIGFLFVPTNKFLFAHSLSECVTNFTTFVVQVCVASRNHSRLNKESRKDPPPQLNDEEKAIPKVPDLDPPDGSDIGILEISVRTSIDVGDAETLVESEGEELFVKSRIFYGGNCVDK